MTRIFLFMTIAMLLWPARSHAYRCSAVATPIVFSNYDIFSTLPLDTTATLTVTCTNPDKKPVQMTVSLSAGNSGNFNPRQMTYAGAGVPMNYYLFIDPSRTTIFGDGTGGTGTFTSIVSRATSFSTTIYGRVPAQQTLLKAGSYSDSLVVTVTW